MIDGGKRNPSDDFIKLICSLYGDTYDDREEDSRPGGEDWEPGVKAAHLSLGTFQKELKEVHGIEMSTAKLRKILITGGCWTTERSREVASLYEELKDIKRVAEELNVSTALVTMYLPYEKTVYDLEEKSGGANRVQRWRERQAAAPLTTEKIHSLAVKELREHRGLPDELLCLWKAIIAYEGFTFTTSGRGQRPGVRFKYEVSKPGGNSGRRYSGTDVSGYGNELWIITAEGKRGKSISRSTVDLAYKNGLALMEVKGPKALGIPGAGSYIYSMLLEFGVIGGKENAHIDGDRLLQGSADQISGLR